MHICMDHARYLAGVAITQHLHSRLYNVAVTTTYRIKAEHLLQVRLRHLPVPKVRNVMIGLLWGEVPDAAVQHAHLVLQY